MPAQNPRYAKPAGCGGCPLERLGFGYAPPSGPPGASLTFIGEALGYEEGVQGEPFYGAAGGVLSRICHRAGVNRAHARIGNIVSCRPPQDFLVGSPWEEGAIAHCRQYLQPLLAAVPNNGAVMPLGATALAHVLGLTGVKGVHVKDFHGTVTRIDRPDGTGYWVIPTYHPSHLQRGAMNLFEVVCQDVKRAAGIGEKGFNRSPAALIVDPPLEWFSRWVDDHLAKVAADADNVHLSIDTEFPKKGSDEAEAMRDASSPLTRINGGNDRVTGWTVPYRGDYIREVERLMAGVSQRRGWVWLWNKYVDWDKLRDAGHTLSGIEAIDGMWVWHHIQSDLPRGLGFVAPMASDFGAWKHWSEDPAREGKYAAADGVQNWRTCMWVMKGAQDLHQWDMFMRDWHERDQYVLRPAQELGVPVDRGALESFHGELQGKLAATLGRIKETAAQGVLRPKLGYPKKPKGQKCTDCNGKGATEADTCHSCFGTGMCGEPEPPASIMGKPKTGGSEAKQQYMREGVRLVEKEIEIECRDCATCGRENVGAKHKCPRPRPSGRKQQRRRGVPIEDDGRTHAAGTAQPAAVGAGSSAAVPPVASLVITRRPQRRWFWQLPFNPDAPQQILSYLAQQGIDAPVDKKRRDAFGNAKKTTNKKALEELAAQHRDDPFFRLQMDYKAVQKVDATYVVGTLARMDLHDRVHPEYLPIPSTLRDSARNPNLTNVVADKSGVQGLAAGFRRCIVARDGLPPGVTAEEYAAWERKWTTATSTT